MKTHLTDTFTIVWVAILTFGFGAIQPATAASWSTTAPLNSVRRAHTATLLPNGKVLVAGGQTLVGGNEVSAASAELFDPSTGTWQATGSLTNAHAFHTATLLTNGKVLVVGGIHLNRVELYDPARGTWTETGSMNTPRYQHTATLLPNGKLLVAGGIDNFGNSTTSAELYDPATGEWSNVAPMNSARWSHTATLLPNGKLLVAGGGTVINGVSFTLLNSAEVFDPASGTWTSTACLSAGHFDHVSTLLPNGKVLVAGGFNNANSLASTELYDPIAGTWSNSGELNMARDTPTATLLPNGKVLVSGGYGSGGTYLSSSEIYDPAAGTWLTEAGTTSSRWQHTATLLANGKVLLAAGYDGTALVASAELFDPATSPSTGACTNTGIMHTARKSHTATLLPNGMLLITGGAFRSTNSELYNYLTGLWSMSGAANTTREHHTANLLPNGKVLIAGGHDDRGFDFSLSGSELYNPASQTWTNTGSLNAARYLHTATLLANGKVLVTGGSNHTNAISTSDLYDPTTGSWTPTGPLITARGMHTANLLPDGRVLVTGGIGSNDVVLSSVEIFNPSTGTWLATGQLGTGRASHLAALLPNGKVLVAGGTGPTNSSLSSAELYDPINGVWTNTGPMTASRTSPAAILLQNGKLLVTGGSAPTPPTSAELYDPATGKWTSTGSMSTSRYNHTATLLPNGRILIAGGQDGGTSSDLSTAELYAIGLGLTNAWRPQIASVTSPLNPGSSLFITGAKFGGGADGSSGNSHDSSADYPLVQLRSLESGRTTFLLTTNWSASLVTSVPVTNFPPGYALATVFVNGIQSTSSIVNITISVSGPTAPILTGSTRLANGSFRFAFTSSAGASFQAVTTTNLLLPISDWTVLGTVPEITAGQFQFTDVQATNNPQRFYRVRSL